MIPVNDLGRGFRLYQKEYEDRALEVLRSGFYILGKQVEAFEKEFAASLGDGALCVGVDNGLDAITLGLLAAGIKEGDEVIVQANGYIATMLGILQINAKPVFVEPGDTPEILQRRVMEEAEWQILPRAVELVCQEIIEERETET